MERGIPKIWSHLDGHACHSGSLSPRRPSWDGYSITQVSGQFQRAIGLLTEVLWLALALAIIRYTFAIMVVARNQDSPGLGLPMHWVYFGMVLGSAYLAFVAVRRLATYFGWQDPLPDDLNGH